MSQVLDENESVLGSLLTWSIPLGQPRNLAHRTDCLLRRWLSVINTNYHAHQSLVIEDVLSIDDLVHWLSIININCHGLTLRLELCIVLSCLCFLVWTAHGQRTRLAPTHVPPRWQVLTVTFAVVLSTR